jgi:hypothetical protein
LISFVQRGEIKRGLDATKLRGAIFDALDAGPRKDKEQKHSETDSETEEIAHV